MQAVQEIIAYTHEDWKLFALAITVTMVVAWLGGFSGGQMVKTREMTATRVRVYANTISVLIICWAGLTLGVGWLNIGGWAFLNVLFYERTIRWAFRMSRAKRDTSPRWEMVFYFLRPQYVKRGPESPRAIERRQNGNGDDDGTKMPTRF